MLHIRSVLLTIRVVFAKWFMPLTDLRKQEKRSLTETIKVSVKNPFLEMLVLPMNEPPSPSRKIRVNIYGSLQ